MIDSNAIEDSLKMVGTLTGQLNKLLKLQENALKTLPLEDQKQLSGLNRDVKKLMKLAKEGDLMAINEISKKYAGKHNK